MDIKEKITGLLLSTGRENISNVIEYMESNGFFTAPSALFFMTSAKVTNTT